MKKEKAYCPNCGKKMKTLSIDTAERLFSWEALEEKEMPKDKQLRVLACYKCKEIDYKD